MIKAIVIMIGLFTTAAVQAQEKWILKSKYLAKSDTVLVFKPTAYKQAKQYPLVYLLHGYSENYRQWSKTTDLQKLADRYGFIIVTPDGFVSWYVNSPFDKKLRYEDFFFDELLPKVHHSFNIDEKNIFISGLSMGGYGALRYFITHHNYFNTAGSTSGALALDFDKLKTASLQFFGNRRLTDDLERLLGNHLNHNWNRYSISELIKNYPVKKTFLLDCGTEDILFSATLELKSLADHLKIPITFISQPGNHDTDYWRKSIEYHFVFFQQNLKK
ncbi:alpha/beta hydrolase [Pedobacter sp. KLB.chiD]|uniref:alpha/beta hydrolase n=1 Tax=Pedobacter sp. KLB.chiD TaxID=3387402 RepID=UPI00399B0BB8